MFSKILIANRGEIAVRIIRACKEMGVSTVAIYSEADRNALHVALADQSYCIGGPEASSSYLNEDQIISAAILSGAQAIHPGYGFLSENAYFARLCRKNGLVFIGPEAWKGSATKPSSRRSWQMPDFLSFQVPRLFLHRRKPSRRPKPSVIRSCSRHAQEAAEEASGS